jgi:hypothetical protein
MLVRNDRAGFSDGNGMAERHPFRGHSSVLGHPTFEAFQYVVPLSICPAFGGRRSLITLEVLPRMIPVVGIDDFMGS